MRLPAEKVKDALLHADKYVRTFAAIYLDAFSPDPTIMPVVIQAIERYGWNDAFLQYWFLSRLLQTDETIRWLIGHVDDEDRCLLALRNADPAVLKPHESELISLALEDRDREAISERIRLMSWPPGQLWADLGVFCNEHEYDTLADYWGERSGFHLVEALGKHKDRFAEQVLTIVQGETGDRDNWMQGFAIMLAGEWKLEAAIPDLFEWMDVEDHWILEESQNALVKIGTEAVVEHIAKKWPMATFRLVGAIMLSCIHSDFSVKTAVDLLAVESHEFHRGFLLRAVLKNFATEGIEPARQYILSTSVSHDVLHVRSALLIACTLLGERFPEFDAWFENFEHDPE